MILTPIDHAGLASRLPAFRRALAGHGLALTVLDHVTRLVPEGDLMRLSMDEHHHAQGVALCRRFGLGVLDADPQAGYTWDGRSVAVRMEPSVVIHEVAHYQCAAPHRRALPDFGLGAGPETGAGRGGADAVRMVHCPDSDVEEGLTSLLGILWEARLDQPAILAFLEQNWLEDNSAGHFIKTVDMLHRFGLIGPDGWPTMALRHAEDAPFFAAWFAA